MADYNPRHMDSRDMESHYFAVYVGLTYFQFGMQLLGDMYLW